MVKKYFRWKYVVAVILVIILLPVSIFAYRNRESRRQFKNAYELILMEWERVWEDKTYNMEPWKNVDKEALTLISHPDIVQYHLGYSLVDLTDDGICELVIGIIGGNYREYLPIAIYGYTEKEEFREAISCMYRTAGINIYQNGIFETTGGFMGLIFYSYGQLQSITPLRKHVCTLYEREEKDGVHYSCSSGSDDAEIEISEQEYLDRKNELTKGKVDLEWKSLEGFWYRQEGADILWFSIAEDKYRYKNCSHISGDGYIDYRMCQRAEKLTNVANQLSQGETDNDGE